MQLQMIKTEKLLRHPKNPRKDLGDLTELSASIKTSEIRQNLTVIPENISEYNKMISQKRKYQGSYIIVIGHRRHAAAQLAGVAEVPCSISTMSEKEQLATMLLENMQRTDLSELEQAEGFEQLTLLGETTESISKLTGFSKTTIKRRMNLLSLDRNKLIEAQRRGGTLSDYDELLKIKDIELRNEVLEHIGTSNFKWKLDAAISKEKTEKNKQKIITLINEFATECKSGTGLAYVRWIPFNNDGDFSKPDNAEEVNYFYTFSSYGINLYMEKAEVDSESSEEKEANEEEAALKKEKLTQLKEISNRAYMLRVDFIRNFNLGKKHIPYVIELVAKAMLTEEYFYMEDFINIIELSDEDEAEISDTGATLEKVCEATKFSPEKVVMLMSYSYFDNSKMSYTTGFSLIHKKSNELDCVYDFLVKFGYEMSDEEKALQDGTHELFEGEE